MIDVLIIFQPEGYACEIYHKDGRPFRSERGSYAKVIFFTSGRRAWSYTCGAFNKKVGVGYDLFENIDGV
jgi:hypothetical protein